MDSLVPRTPIPHVFSRERGCTARAGGGASSKQCYHEYVTEEKGLDSLAELAYFVLYCFTTSRCKTGKYACYQHHVFDCYCEGINE